MIDIAENLAAVRQRIAAAAARAGRDAGGVRLIAVAKTKPVELVHAAVVAGLRDIGENYVQEAAAKRAALGGDVTWHLIGRLQRNKIGKALDVFDLIHSVDSAALGAALARRAGERGRRVRALVEVNVSGERSKGGVAPQALPALLDELRRLPLSVEGLMTVPAAGMDPRPQFAQLRALRDAANLSELSMGMSDDFEIAIEEGATMVRVGRAIFGER
jgi:pyridoxal phosphate enzyme (YggS family)